MYYFENGNEAKKFNTRDGMAFKILKNKNIKKEKILDEICDTYKVSYEDVAYVGDDINDIGILEKVKMSFCPRDAHREVKQRVQYIMNTNGGQGVIREIVDTFLGDKVE